MTITVQIPHDIELKIHEKVSRGDTKAVRKLLLDALVFSVVEKSIIRSTPPKLSNEEYEVLADQLADEFMDYVGANFPHLSDYAVSREGIYEDSVQP
ncbi:hypothetical protein L0Z72_10810 [candidate division KSB1 bacterium]|nr:hypothetical protein [candidate division KSB1 bacterium]